MTNGGSFNALTFYIKAATKKNFLINFCHRLWIYSSEPDVIAPLRENPRFDSTPA